MDPGNISSILRAHPYHIDSLLQLSEVLKIQGDVQMAADFVERAGELLLLLYQRVLPQMGCTSDSRIAINRTLIICERGLSSPCCLFLVWIVYVRIPGTHIPRG